MKENRHERHSHYFIEWGSLYESFRKSRGDLGYNFIKEVDLPDCNKLTEEQIKEIFDGEET